jgi:N4-gp56 family major capsid protein
MAYFDLRSRPLFRQWVSVEPADLTNQGKIAYIPKHRYLTVAANRHVLDEVIASDQVQPGASTYVKLLLKEHGNRVGRTTFAGDTAYIPLDPVMNEQLVTHMADTLDAMVGDELYSGSQVVNTGTEAGDSTVPLPATQLWTSNAGAIETPAAANNTLLTTDVLSARIVRRVVAKLRSASVRPIRGALYQAIVHPDVSVDYQEDAGSVAWSPPHINVDTGAIYSGETGVHAGAIFAETPRARFVDNAGSGGIDVHQTMIFGREALAQWVKREPGPGVGPMVDPYRRHVDIHWYGTLGFTTFRQEAMHRIHHGFSGGQSG